jgi:hypothetical protein
MPQQGARINPIGKVVAEDRHLHVRKNPSEDVMWVALGNSGPWLITFDKVCDGSFKPGSPFYQDEIYLPRGEFAQTTGGPRPDAEYGTYKYNVREARSRIIVDDPDIDIEG